MNISKERKEIRNEMPYLQRGLAEIFYKFYVYKK